MLPTIGHGDGPGGSFGPSLLFFKELYPHLMMIKRRIKARIREGSTGIAISAKVASITQVLG